MHLLIPLYISPILLAFYGVQSMLALFALLLSAAPVWLTGLCALLWLYETLSLIRRKRPIGLLVSDSGVVLSFTDHNIAVRMHRRCFCSRYLVILRLHETQALKAHRKRRHFTLVLLPDSCPSASHRQLRTALRWYSFDAQTLLP